LRDDSGTRFGTDSAPVDPKILEETTAALRKRGIKGRLIAHNGGLYWRGTFTGSDGERKDRRVHLGLPAEDGQRIEAETRVVTLASVVARSGILPDLLPWSSESRKSSGSPLPTAITVADAVTELEAAFWHRKERTSAAVRTWERLKVETDRLPQNAVLTVKLLASVADSTPAGSRTRLEACKVFKRLGRLVELEGVEQLDELRTKYRPQRRKLPSDEEIAELLADLPINHHWSWPTWALATYGCRPAEVFSLKPDSDGTAQLLSVKQKNERPDERTALALKVGETEEPKDNRSWRVNSPAEYDSLEAKRLTGAWGKWLVARSNGIQLYDLRHAWAIRSIHRGINPSLAAKTMGHSLEVHSRTYHRELSKRDVAAVAAALSQAQAELKPEKTTP
jgi:integrase